MSSWNEIENAAIQKVFSYSKEFLNYKYQPLRVITCGTGWFIKSKEAVILAVSVLIWVNNNLIVRRHSYWEKIKFSKFHLENSHSNSMERKLFRHFITSGFSLCVITACRKIANPLCWYWFRLGSPGSFMFLRFGVGFLGAHNRQHILQAKVIDWKWIFHFSFSRYFIPIHLWRVIKHRRATVFSACFLCCLWISEHLFSFSSAKVKQSLLLSTCVITSLLVFIYKLKAKL